MQTAKTEMADVVNWAELNHDLLVLVALRIEKLEDFVSFGSVCTGWHAAAATKKDFKGLRLWQQIPCLMLAMRDELHTDRQFYSLHDKEITATVNLPNFKGKRCIESLGWFLCSGKDGDMSLLHPFTGQEIQLPHQNTYPNNPSVRMDGYIFMERAVLSARPDETSDYVLMVICGGRSELAFWRPGDTIWNPIKYNFGRSYSNVTYHAGKFYAISNQGYLVVCDPSGSNPTEGQTLARILSNKNKNVRWGTPVYDDELLNYNDLYIVGGSISSRMMLLVIVRYSRSEDDESDEAGYMKYNTRKFRAFEVDASSGKWEEIKSLGNRAVFLGHSATTLVDTSKLRGGTITGNHIYFTADGFEGYYNNGGGMDMGIFSFETGNIERFYPQGELLSKICPCIWVTPKF